MSTDRYRQAAKVLYVANQWLKSHEGISVLYWWDERKDVELRALVDSMLKDGERYCEEDDVT